ncbi:MAG: CBS domain-containing protein [Myxococcales bacterium]|nr:MAG: CBS domain-containing protein [Myxococcales bacterium]
MTIPWQSTLLSPADSLRRTIERIDASSLQIGLVVDADGRLLGTVTDGDVRRAILRGTRLEAPVTEVMNPQPTVGRQSESVSRRRALLQARDLRQLPIVDAAGKLIGLETLASIDRRRDNWAVLMAGGKGVRLRPLTDDRPKPLLDVGGRPILETILERLIGHGFGRFFLSINYKGHMIEEHFGDGSRWGVQIEYLREDQPLGTAGALQLLPEAPTEPVLVMNGDLLTSVDFGQLLGFHESRRPWATMCVREYDFQVPYGVVRIDGHQLVGFDEKPVHRFFVNAGIYVLSPEALGLVPPGRPCDMPTLFQDITSRGQSAAVFPVREYWMDIGQLEDFKRAQQDFAGIFGPGARS